MNVIGVIAAALAVLNLISFGLMAYDKRCAKAGKWRIPEKTLFLCRHKTKHWYFRVFFPLMLAAQAALLVFGYLYWLKP